MMMPEAIHSSLNTKPFITTMSTPSSKFLSIPSFPIQPHPQIITTSPPQIPPFKPTQSPSISKMTPRIAAQPSSFHLYSHLHTAHIPCPIATSRFHNTTIKSIASVSRSPLGEPILAPHHSHPLLGIPHPKHPSLPEFRLKHAFFKPNRDSRW